MKQRLSNKRIDNLVRQFELYAAQIQTATAETLDETSEQKSKRIKQLLKDPKGFQEYYLSFLKETPDYLITAAKKVLKDPDFFGWWMMFRGARKSTWLAQILPLMLLARGELNFMLLIGPNEDFAMRLLGSLQTQLENNKRFISDFGEQRIHGSWADREFTTKKGISFLGLGMGQPIRGLNIQMKRPDYIVASDIDSKELSKNPARCREMYHWLLEDVGGTREAGEKARFVFDNNYFSKTSIGNHFLTENPEINISRVDVLDKDGKPVAPFITEEWIAKARKKGYRAFMREYMNTPVEEGNIFRADWIQWKEMKDWGKYDYIVAYCDPSWKAHTGADYKAIAVIGKKGNEYHILKAFCRQCTLTTMVKWHYDFASRLKERDIHIYNVVEGGFIQDSIRDAYDAESELRGKYIDVLVDNRKKDNKHVRIEAISVKWERGVVYYNVSEKDDPDMLTGLDQTLAFEQGTKSHDDFPDACEGGISWLEQRRGFGNPCRSFAIGRKRGEGLSF